MKPGPKARSAQKQTNQNDSSSVSTMTLFQAYEYFLANRSLAKNTMEQFRRIMNNNFPDWLNLELTEITPDMIEQKHRFLLAKKRRRGASGRTSVCNAFGLLSSLIRFASRTQSDGPALKKLISLVRMTTRYARSVHSSRRETIPDDKLRDWYHAIATADHDVTRDYLLFLLFTGIRLLEARQLQWSMIDFQTKTLHVPASITRRRRAYNIPLSSFVVDLLALRFKKRVHSDWVFQSARDRSTPICDDNWLIVRKLRAKCGVNFQLNDLRRTFRHRGESLEVHLLTLYALMDIKTKDMTARYVIPDIESMRSATEKISCAFIASMNIDVTDLSAPRRIALADTDTGIQLQLNFSQI